MCEGKDCIETSPEMPVSMGPVVSSEPSCPITEFKFMHHDENGIPTHEVDPDILRVETIGTMMRVV